MKIAHVCHSFSNLSETFIYDIINTQHKSGDECHILTFKRENKTKRPFPNERVYEIKKSIWNLKRYWNYFSASFANQNKEIANWNLYRQQLKKRLQEIQPDIIHAHFGPMGVFAAPVARQLKLPLVVTFYGYDISQLLRDDFWQEKYHQLADDVAAVTVLSQVMKKEAVKAGFDSGKIHIVHLGRDLSKFEYTEVGGSLKTFLSVGRLTPKKGHLDTLKAFQKIHQKNEDVELKIIGEGKLKDELQAFIIKHKLEKAVFLLGSRSNEQVMEEMKRADAFVLTSKTAANGDQEGTPTVFIEAQACGLPCISTMHAGIPEIIPEANHRFLAPEGDVEAIADCMETLLQSSPEERNTIGALGRKKVEKEFNIETEVKKLMDVYHEV